jgi:glycerol-3-phosphate acyltransferase PlsY
VVVLEVVLAFLAAFLVGSLPSAYIFTALFAPGRDLKKEGTGNVGTENAWLVAGPAAGLLTGLFDFTKGGLVITAAHFLLGWSFQEDLIKLLSLSVFVVLGHDYPPWLRFKGGLGFAVITSTILYFSFLTWFAGSILLAITLFIWDTPKKVGAQHFIAWLGIPVSAILFLLQNGRGWRVLSFGFPDLLGQPVENHGALFWFCLLWLLMYTIQRSRYRGFWDDVKAGIPFWRALWLRALFEAFPVESAWRGPDPDRLQLTDQAMFSRRKHPVKDSEGTTRDEAD